MALFRDAAAVHGRDLKLGEEVGLGYRFFIAESQERAIELARPYYEEALKFAAPLGLTALTSDQIEAVAAGPASRGVKLPTLEEAVASGTWLCGPPELIIEHFERVEQQYPGVERINMGAVMGMPLEVFKDQLTQFSEEVMPEFVGRSG